MTMHLVRGMSSINSKARKQNRKPGWQKAQAEHDKWLMDRGCHSSQIKMKKKEFKEYVPSRPAPRRRTQSLVTTEQQNVNQCNTPELLSSESVKCTNQMLYQLCGELIKPKI
jgi:hypothetical protein